MPTPCAELPDSVAIIALRAERVGDVALIAELKGVIER